MVRPDGARIPRVEPPSVLSLLLCRFFLYSVCSVVLFHAVRFYCGWDLSPTVAVREVGLKCFIISSCRVCLSCPVLSRLCLCRVVTVQPDSPQQGLCPHARFFFFDRTMIHEGAHWTTGAYNNLVMSKWIRERK